MKTITSPSGMQRQALVWRAQERTVVLVPTMGALHEAHRCLIRLAHKKAGKDGVVVVSIYVNPLQFNDPKDLHNYPRSLEADKKLCREESVDVVFAPHSLYENDASVEVFGNELTACLEGSSRPGHFTGVMTVVAKLLNLVQPNFAVFGEKDFQQVVVIKRMIRDLNYRVSIVTGPLVREKSGLAVSSRNSRLKGEFRDQAAVLWQAIQLARQSGGSRTVDVRRKLKRFIEKQPDVRVDYVEIVDTLSLKPVKVARKGCRLLLAAWVGSVRLIDNALL